jgi:hypothetical protein
MIGIWVDRTWGQNRVGILFPHFFFPANLGHFTRADRYPVLNRLFIIHHELALNTDFLETGKRILDWQNVKTVARPYC